MNHINCECPDCDNVQEAKAVCWLLDDGGGDENALHYHDEAMAYDMSDPEGAMALGWFPTCIECLQNLLAEAGVGDDAQTWTIQGVTYWRKNLVVVVVADDSESEEEEEEGGNEAE